jgi:hypothetical protein
LDAAATAAATCTVHHRHALQEATLKLCKFCTAALQLLFGKLVHIISPAFENLLADAVLPDKLFRNTHGVAIQQLGQKSTKRRAVRKGQTSCLEFANQTKGIVLFLWCPLSASRLLLLVAAAS